jgi:hypothetical protein
MPCSSRSAINHFPSLQASFPRPLQRVVLVEVVLVSRVGSRSCRVAAAPLEGPSDFGAVNEYFPWTLMCFLTKGLSRVTSSSRTEYP